eukprot:TRINITY_DN7469_c0_g1_i1.p1 TRINITY_DN7469_c0_g1~~TRINITY_DN7469_c0_g1_i1.p1  ORF type:complete len:251 (+),score=28.36 TRINITY_DN7469_c0_g1_i1:111-863(+)
MPGVEEAFNSMPLITRWYLLISFSTTLAANFGILQARNLYFDLSLAIFKLQLWRIFSCFLYLGPLGFPFVISLILIYRYFQNTERDVFFGRTADFVHALLLGAVVLLATSLLLKVPFLGMPLVFYVLYIWCMANPNAQASFFGFSFKAAYLPWVLAGFQLLLGGFPMGELMGIGSGHVYHFLKNLYPLQHGGQQLFFMKTPDWMRLLFPQVQAPLPGQGFYMQPGAAQQGPAQPARGRQLFPGRGQALGQ